MHIVKDSPESFLATNLKKFELCLVRNFSHFYCCGSDKDFYFNGRQIFGALIYIYMCNIEITHIYMCITYMSKVKLGYFGNNHILGILN